MADLNGRGIYIKLPGEGVGGKFSVETKQQFKDGEPAWVLNMVGAVSQKWAGWGQLSICLEEADLALKSLVDLGDGDDGIFVKKALWFFAVIQYGKCFQGNEGWGGVMLNARVTLSMAGHALLDEHKGWMNARNTFVAHGGESDAHGFAVSVLVRPSSPNRIEELQAFHYTAITPHLSAVRRMRKAIEAHQKWVVNHKRDLERRIFLDALCQGFELAEAQAKMFKIGTEEIEIRKAEIAAEEQRAE